MTVIGEGKAPTIREVYKIGDNHSIKKKEMNSIIEQIIDASKKFFFYAEEYAISADIRKEIAAKIQGNISNFKQSKKT